jgi:predicted RNA polymerase sigma factor
MIRGAARVPITPVIWYPEEKDRRLWDQDRIKAGESRLRKALSLGRIRPYRRALELTHNDAEQRFLEQRLHDVSR